jgi:hypothetical protein
VLCLTSVAAMMCEYVCECARVNECVRAFTGEFKGGSPLSAAESSTAL